MNTFKISAITDTLQSLQLKMQEYIENGVQLGWLIDRQNQQVEVYRAGQPKEVLPAPSSLLGELVLPDFELNLQWMWQA